MVKTPVEELKLISDTLELASHIKIVENGEQKEVDLSTEILWSAMNYLRESDNTVTIEDALEYGYNEWVK